MTDQPRTPKGQPTGGQFATTARPEAGVSLTGVPSPPDMDSLGALYTSLTEEFPTADVGLKLCERTPGGDRYVVLEMVRFPEDERRQGNGTRFLQRLTEHADTHRWTLALTPNPSFGSDLDGLDRLYQRHGFIPTRSAAARKHAYGVHEDMLRPPQTPASARSQRLDPAIAHRIDARALLQLLPNADQVYLSDVRLELARHIARGRPRSAAPYGTWEDAWNDLTRNGNEPIRLPSARCPTCHGRGIDTRHAARNMTRTGNPAICGECYGRRRTTVTLRTRPATPPRT